MDALILILLGLIASFYGTMVGAGGGFLFVPLLLLIFGLPPQMAAGTGLAVVFMSSFFGVFAYRKQHRILYKEGIILSAGAIPGTFLGSALLRNLSGDFFHYIFALLLLSVGLFLLVKRPPERALPQRQGVREEVSATLEASPNWLMLFLVGLGIGVLSSFFGIGGGWLLVPLLIYMFKVDSHKATATSIFALAIYSLVGMISPMMHGDIDWSIVLWSGIGVILGSQLGVIVSRLLNAKWITRMLATVALVVGVTLLV
ncbi:sulfite exporter TauE/SafE family protein [Aureibacillus halotolerans]|uniref:Probable membrane transporter protein n=1 Tax=Aureibacillus halotolerans TaxID=1508390 RepID=A0A4V3D5S4_9BACI|nr:sulfite exporter TauE/SafE family protein [Aureibacillus halotolerans]TDQ41207.1 hypothetical protein EV213_104205 [Aureibacillus halotolerans]